MNVDYILVSLNAIGPYSLPPPPPAFAYEFVKITWVVQTHLNWNCVSCLFLRWLRYLSWVEHRARLSSSSSSSNKYSWISSDSFFGKWLLVTYTFFFWNILYAYHHSSFSPTLFLVAERKKLNSMYTVESAVVIWKSLELMLGLWCFISYIFFVGSMDAGRYHSGHELDWTTWILKTKGRRLRLVGGRTVSIYIFYSSECLQS